METKYIVYSIHKVKKIGCTREDQWNLRLASHLRKYKNILPEDMTVMKVFNNINEADQYEYDMQTKYGYNHDTNRYSHIALNMVPKALQPKNLKKRVETYKQTLKERPELWITNYLTSESRKKQGRTMSKISKEKGDWHKRMHTSEAREKSRLKNIGKIGSRGKDNPNSKPLKAWKDGKYIGKFYGAGDASRKLKIKGVIISNVANPNQKVQSWKGWTFKYI